ncbi:hypothetical protein JCM9279_006675 [Rhodotorula babjevae]
MATVAAPSFDEDDLLDRSPALALLRRKRLAPSRWRDLVKAAASSRPPKEPEPWECCGSSCKPCVLELYREERKVWQEVHPNGVSDDEDEGEGEAGEDEARAAGAAPLEEDQLECTAPPAHEAAAAQRKADSPALEIELEAMALVDPATAELQATRLVEAAG